MCIDFAFAYLEKLSAWLCRLCDSVERRTRVDICDVNNQVGRYDKRMRDWGRSASR